MPVKNFSSIGGFAVGSTEVCNTEYALKNISAIHMTSNNFADAVHDKYCLLYTSPSPRDGTKSRMPSSA